MRIEWKDTHHSETGDAMQAFVHSQRKIEELLDRLSEQLDDGRRLRTTKRVPMYDEVTMNPIDAQGRMCGPTLQVPARWITADGLAFVHARPVGLNRVLITLKDAPTGHFPIAAGVLSTRSIGSTVEVIVRFEKERDVPRPHSLAKFRQRTSAVSDGV